MVKDTGSGEGLIAGASMALSAGTAFLRAARALGRNLSPVFERAGMRFGTVASIAAIAYEVHQEEGIGHKAERTGAGVVSAGVNMALGSAAATAGETAALTGVAGATGATVIAAAAPVALSVAAAAATAKVADLSIENRRAYERLDRDLARDALPAKIRNKPDTEKPSLLDYKHLGAMLGVTAHLRDGSLHATGRIERFAGSGRMRNPGVIDMTDPVNQAEYERALNEEIDRQRRIMEANDSLLPRWMRHGESVERYEFADGELKNLLGAKEELALLRQDVQRYNEQLAAAPGFNSAAAGAPAQAEPQGQAAVRRTKPLSGPKA